MQYIEIIQTILKHKFHLERSQPRHLAQRTRSAAPNIHATGPDDVIEAFRTAQHVLEMYRRTLEDSNSRRLNRLSNRVTKLVTEVRALK